MAPTRLTMLSYCPKVPPTRGGKLPIGVMASHGGTNLQAILDACAAGSLDAEVRVVISNNSRSMALERARRARIPTAHLSAATHPAPALLDKAISDTLAAHAVELVALAGYMRKLGPQTLGRYRNRVLNVHPALLPKFGGQGMYGERVHAAVLAAGERVSGVSVHVVDEEYDHGPVIAQAEVPIMRDDTPETLASRVLEWEHTLYPQTIQRIASGEIDLDSLGQLPHCEQRARLSRSGENIRKTRLPYRATPRRGYNQAIPSV